METVTLFLGAPKLLQMVIAAMKLRYLLLGRKVMTNLDSILKSRDVTLPTKVWHSQGYILSPCLFNLYARYIMRNAGLEEAQAGIEIARRGINNLRYVDDTTLMAESEEELKSLLMKVKEESGKTWLKVQHSENEDHGIWSHHFTANRWGNSGNSVRLSFLGLQNHCRW